MKKNVYLFQPQYVLTINNQLNSWIPYSVGCLWSYVSQFDHIKSKYQLKDIIFKREKIENILNRLENPEICGFSCYLWNKNYCLALAEKIKAKFPKCQIVFGGPEVSDRIMENTFIDSIVSGEGEHAFLELLEDYASKNTILNKYDPQRINSLETLPSPYTTGVFDYIIENNPNTVWAVTLETNRGCPYACTFCDWGQLTYSKVKKFEMEKIKKDIQWVKNNPISYVYFADANFGIFKERDLEIAKFIARETKNHPTLDLISVQSAKNSTEMAFEIGKILGSKYAGVTLSLQSLNDDTLVSIKRKNFKTNDLKKQLKLAEEYEVPSYSELILGLPDETKESWINGLGTLLEAGQHNGIEMWLTQMLENSELSSSISRFEHNIKTIKTADYISLKDGDESGVDEVTELICSTATMSLNDMVESYMYGWLIIQFHVSGYSQICSRYLYSVKEISYTDFYKYIFEVFKQDKMLYDHYVFMHSCVSEFLKTGKLSHKVQGHVMHMHSAPWIYENKNYIMDLVYSSANEKFGIPSWVFDLQKSFIYDKNQTTRKTIIGDSNYFTGEKIPTVYEIQPKLKNSQMSELSPTALRRKGLLKNRIKALDNS